MSNNQECVSIYQCLDIVKKFYGLDCFNSSDIEAAIRKDSKGTITNSEHENPVTGKTVYFTTLKIPHDCKMKITEAGFQACPDHHKYRLACAGASVMDINENLIRVAAEWALRQHFREEYQFFHMQREETAKLLKQGLALAERYLSEQR